MRSGSLTMALIVAMALVMMPVLSSRADRSNWNRDQAVGFVDIRAEVVRLIEVKVSLSSEVLLAGGGTPGFAPGSAPPAQLVIRGTPYIVNFTVDTTIMAPPLDRAAAADDAMMERVDVQPLVIVRSRQPRGADAPPPSPVPQGPSDTVTFTLAALSSGVVDRVNTVSVHFQ